MQHPAPKPIVLTLDIEPTPRHGLLGLPHEWDGFEAIVEYLVPWRDRVLERTGRPLPVSWFFRADGQVDHAHGSPTWVIERFRSTAVDLLALGDEFGVHPHPYRWGEAADSEHQDFLDQSWVHETVRTAIDGLNRILGIKTTVFRMGDAWMSNGLADLIEEMGVRYDLTIEPGRPARGPMGPDKGRWPDYTHALHIPYLASRTDFRVPATDEARNLWMIPVTMAHRTRLGLTRRPLPFVSHVDTLNVGDTPRFMLPFIDRVLATPAGVRVVVGRTGDATKKGAGHRVFENLDHLLGHSLLDDYVFATAAEAVEMFAGRPAAAALVEGA